MFKFNRNLLFMLLIAGVVSLSTGKLYAQIFPNLGGQRAGTATAQFLKIGIGARAMAMGEAYVAVANDAEALYWNPAGISRFKNHAVFFSHTQWLVDVDVEYGGIVYHLDPVNTFGLAFTYLHTDEMKETTELQPFGTGRFFSFSDFLVAISYARNMTDKFSFGLSVKYMHENIAELTMNGLLFDLGTYYDTGWNSLRFAVAVTNIGQEMQPEGSYIYQDLAAQEVEVNKFQSFPPPIMFRLGLAGEIFKTTDNRITSSIQLNHPNDNKENLNFGLEYMWRDILALRAGYKSARVEEDFSAGLGLKINTAFSNIRVDYAFTNFGRLGAVNRFSLHFEF
jgi:long-subunit fatty acid transport protein